MSQTLSFKVSLKGAVSVYGLGRFPITLYPSQWAALMANGGSLAQFMADNQKALEEGPERYKAALVVAERKGVVEEKAKEEFVKRLLGFDTAPKTTAKTTTAKSSLVDELMRKAV